MRSFLHHISSLCFIFCLKTFPRSKTQSITLFWYLYDNHKYSCFLCSCFKDVYWRRVQNSIHHWQRLLKLPSFVTCVNFIILFVPASVLNAFRNGRRFIQQLSLGTDYRLHELQVILQSFDTAILVNRFILFTVTSYLLSALVTVHHERRVKREKPTGCN